MMWSVQESLAMIHAVRNYHDVTDVKALTIQDLRRFAVSRSLFPPVTLQASIDRLGFVQADPIRAPARAQDLTLRHRVEGYRAGDLERYYADLDVEEEIFINYGFVSRSVERLMQPRAIAWRVARGKRVRAILGFVRAQGSVHPRQVDARFSHGRVTNYWGGSSSATTHLMEHMHYYGLLRVVRREAGIRIYALRTSERGEVTLSANARIDALVDLLIRIYGPVPALSLSNLVSRLRYAVPQWRGELKDALTRARDRLAHARVDGTDWYWPAGENVENVVDRDPVPTARLLAPFDPIVWDRRRFELFWEWPYRFEAYTPVHKRKFGYYALPLLWRDRVVGWGNVSSAGGRATVACGYVSGSPPRDRHFKRELEGEVARLRLFLGLEGNDGGRLPQPVSSSREPAAYSTGG
jgi:hypothetical protein